MVKIKVKYLVEYSEPVISNLLLKINELLTKAGIDCQLLEIQEVSK